MPKKTKQQHSPRGTTRTALDRNAEGALRVILDVLTSVDRRRAMRLVEAAAAVVTFTAPDTNEPRR